MSLSRLVARPMLASMFLVGGLNSLRDAPGAAERAKPVIDTLNELVGEIPLSAENLVRANAAVHLIAGSALATGRAPRTSALVLAATLVPTTFGGHRFWEESDEQTKRNQMIHFFKNVSMLGGLIIAAGDTEGRPGLAWRAKHAVSDARQTASSHLPIG